jgi:hypothetical protein
MFYLDENNQRYYVGTPFTYNNIQYTRAGATAETFISLGFTPVTIQPRPDERFYIVSGPDDTGAYNATPRDLTELKEQFVADVKAEAHEILSRTDWYVIRAIESGLTGVPSAVPAGATTYRAAVRAASDARCEALYAAADIPALQALLDLSNEFPEEPETY